MFKKIAVGLVCLTLFAWGITSFQDQVNLPGKYQLVPTVNAEGNSTMYKINTTNGDTWILESDRTDFKNKWFPLPHGTIPE